MYLSNLDIIGFKTFANKTSFKFSDGLTALVGPNGSGKTNIVDAIRWVLGETKTSVLRSDVMEDVIFNGTNKRKPLGMAEVSMTLQNNKKILPTEYTEVTVARRLFRNGESQFFLNNTQCRLKDIHNLFMDTGLGTDSYSVIELKMVEAILSGKPEERRSLIEEAAGVKKYKIRRKEARKKLQNIRADLLRVKDIVLEVEKQVNILSRQASKTRRYNKLTEELKELDIKLLYHQYNNYKTISDKLNTELKELSDKKSQKLQELNSNEISLNELKDRLNKLDEIFQNTMEEESKSNQLIASQNQEIAIAKEKISSLEIALKRINNELSEFNEAYLNLNNLIASTEKSLKELRQKMEKAEKELNLEQKARDKFINSVQKAREDAKIKNQEVFSIQNQISSIMSEFERGNYRKVSLERSMKESSDEIEKMKYNLEKEKNDLKQEQSKREVLNNRLSISEKDLKIAQEKQIELQKDMENIRNEIASKKIELNENTSSLEFLTSLVDSDQSTKFLMQNKEWYIDGEKLLLSEVVSTEDKFRIAVDAALGEYSKYFVVDSKDDALKAISLLKSNEKGKVSFICRNIIPKIAKPNEKDKRDGVYGLVSELVRVDDDLRSALRIILDSTVLVENQDIAWELIDKGDYNCAVTLNGELIKKYGVIRGGSKLKSEGLRIGKKERIEKLKNNIQQIEKRIEQLNKIYNDAKNEYDSIDIMDLNDKVRRVSIEITQHEQLINQINSKINTIENNITVIEKNKELFKNEIEQILNDANANKEKLKELDSQLVKSKQEQEINNEKVKKLELELNEYQERYNEAEKEKVRYEQQIIALQKEIDNLNQQKVNLEINNQKRKNELKQHSEDIELLKLNIRENQISLKKLEKEALNIKVKKEQTAEEIKSLKEQIEQYSNDIQNLRKEFEKVIDALHQKDLKLNDVNILSKNIVSRASESYEIDIENYGTEIEDDFSINDVQSEVNILKDKLARIGNVNFLALEEYEQQNERLEFYNKQIADLEEAETNLVETIDEINQTAQQKFMDTFDKVNKHFKDLFIKLFGKDADGELKLTDGDPLEADVEIFAKPPGKRPRSIDGLSQGEKTLTAIALLFAIYLVKPSPFCVLDEVDAPLDDANINQYINLIRDFSKNTQFLIVTHNKKTMEAVDTLYGITIQEEGVSKVVSVRLAEEKIL